MTTRRDRDNAAFIERVQRWLGIRPDGWAGSETVAAWRARIEAELPAWDDLPEWDDLQLADVFAAVAPHADLALWHVPLASAAARYQVTTPDRLCAWLAQLAHESEGFVRLDENLNYKSAERLLAVFPSAFENKSDAALFVRNPLALGERVYGWPSEKGKALGNTEPGDGFAYRGGGPIMLTGKRNYALAEASTGLPLVLHPEILRVPGAPAATVAGWYWQARGSNALADKGDFTAITRRIAGSTIGLAHRRELWAAAKRAANTRA